MRSMRRGRSEEVGDGTRPETIKGKEVLLMLNANPATEDMIRDMAREARNGIRRIFLHWTGGHYGHNEDAYHICIDWDYLDTAEEE